MRPSGICALLLGLGLIAPACQSGGIIADDSAPFEEPSTMAAETTTTEAETDNALPVEHRVLVDGSDTGTAYNTAVLSAEDVWELNPDVELEVGGGTVQLLFSAPDSASCPVVGLRGLHFDPDTRFLYPVLERGGSNCAATDVVRPYTVVVDVQRRQLPREFVMSAGPDVPAAGLLGQTTIGLGQLGIPEGDPLALKNPSNMMIGETRFIAFNTHCGVEQIRYLIDGKFWQLVGGPGSGGYIPSEWRRYVEGEGTLMLRVRLSTPELLFVSPTAANLELAYVPVGESELAECL